ncbi:MAG: polysaccharide deacetylase family protein [Rhodanobacteraceae bacterium]
MSRKPSKQDLLRWLPASMVWVNAPRAEGLNYLSFDDGPHPEHTPRVLDLLAEFGIKASFFVIGREAERWPELVKRIAAEGHALGNHSWSHPRFGELTVDAQVAEIDRCDAVLEAFDGQRRHPFRPPRGELSPGLLWRLWRRGQRVIYWTRDSLDYQSRPPAELAAGLHEPPVTAGDIVLMHDDADCARVMLTQLLPYWRDLGLRFAPLPPLTEEAR